jgi:hypothetical protein
MRVLLVFTLCVAASTAACGPQFGFAERASASRDAVGGAATAPIRVADIPERDTIPTGTVPVVVFGSAFGLDRGMLELVIADDMQRAVGGNAQFVPSSQTVDRPQDFIVVIVLNAPRDADPSAYCTGDSPIPMYGPAQRYGAYRDADLAAVLCRSGVDLRQARASADDVWSIDEARFRKMVEQAATELTRPGGETNILPANP